MNFYVARNCPYPVPMNGDVIGFDRVTAEQWDVKYIMKTASTVPFNLLYKEEGGSSFYLQVSDADTFNMLDAFDIPHLNAENNKITYSAVRPQVIANKNGSRSVIIDKNTKDVKGPRNCTILPSLHHDHAVDETMTLPIRPLNYSICIGKYLFSPDNKLTEHNKQ